MLCECGCGKETRIATRNIKKLNHVKGKSVRFICGHYLKSNEYPFLRKKERWILRTRKGSIPWSHVIYEYNFLDGKQIPSGFHVHHKNEIVDDDRPENLEMITAGKHRQVHQNKPVILEHLNGKKLFFKSAREASKYLNLTKHAVSGAIFSKCRIKDFLPYYQEKGKPIDITPSCKKFTKLEKDGKTKTFKSATEASQWLGLSKSAVSTAIYSKSHVAGWKPSYLEVPK